jgi:hypothetical protein
MCCARLAILVLSECRPTTRPTGPLAGVAATPYARGRLAWFVGNIRMTIIGLLDHFSQVILPLSSFRKSARNEVGITVSYWADLESIKAWKAHVEHLAAQKLGREIWYSAFKTRICKVERDYGI